MLLKDKVVIVSGIGPGLGVKLAIEAAREGAKVVAAARSTANLELAQARIAELELGTEVLAQATDIQKDDACRSLVENTVARFGRIDALINSAFRTVSLLPGTETIVDEWRDIMETNVLGTMRMTQAVIPQMLQQRSGAIVMVGTMAARKVGLSKYISYASSKSSMGVMARYLAEELGPSGIRVNTAYPGFMLGDPVRERFLPREASLAGRTEEEVLNDLGKDIPLRRVPTDDECARAVLFLASDYASACTGASLDINGGEYMPL